MKGAKIFCHLDITDAYMHLQVDEEFSKALTLNTPTHGVIRPTRTFNGAVNIPAVWQRTIETVIQSIPNVLNFFDDLLVFADYFSSLLIILGTVLQRLKKHGLRLNRSNRAFASRSVKFLGHKIDAQSVNKSDKHIAAIRDVPKPLTPKDLELFIGKATYYYAFIPDLATKTCPFRDMLLRKPFQWTPAAEKAFIEIKNVLISPQVLMHYDPKLPLILATDASKVGLGAVLSHRLNNGLERPIAFASRTMTATKQRYPQIGKEALAIVWALRIFVYYLYAPHFTLVTNHQPPTQIVHPQKSLPVLCISRMANYTNYLSHFNYNIEIKPTKVNANADYCSRAPLSTTLGHIHKIAIQEGEEITEIDEFDEFILNQIKRLSIPAERVAKEPIKDPHLGKIVQLLEEGESLTRHGLQSLECNYNFASNCLIFEHRVVVPPTLRQPILNDLHAAHIGVFTMKGIARSFVYWPCIDADIERIAKSCIDCEKYAHTPPKFGEHHWEYPKGPWECIHIDYAGPVVGTMFLIVVDAFSKWTGVKTTNFITSTATIAILDELFAANCVPTTAVSDNGKQFTPEEFGMFLKMS